MLIGNAIGASLLMLGLFVAILSFIIAVAVETPVLALLWRRKRIWKWVVMANVASLLAGILPHAAWGFAPSPNESVDPWVWHQSTSLRVLGFSAAVFVLTVIVEGIVYVCFNRSASLRLSPRRLVLATIAANTLSYIPLTAYFVTAARSTGDFAFAPDTQWLATDDIRIYFVDQETNKLFSVRPDGSARALEMDATLGRFQAELELSAFYALLEDDARILFVAPDRNWHVYEAGADRDLGVQLPADRGRARAGDVAASLQQALAEIGVDRSLPTGDRPLQGVYLSTSTQYDFLAKRRHLGDHRVWSGTSPLIGRGPGLRIGATEFSIWAGFLGLACNNPAVLPDDNTVVFRCGDSILVMDFADRRVGRLVRGDSLLLKLPQFSQIEQW